MITLNPDVRPVCARGGGGIVGASCEGRPPGARGWPMDADPMLFSEVFRTGIFDLSEAVDCLRPLGSSPALGTKVGFAVAAVEFSVTERV